MENKKTRVSVFVAGQRFNILTDKSEKYVLDIASEIDARINSLVVTGDMTRERAAVLTALDYADDTALDKEALAEVKEQIKDYLHEIERLSDSNAKLSADYNNLKSEYERLIALRRSSDDAQRKLEDKEKQIAALEEQLKRNSEIAEEQKQRIAQLDDEKQQLSKAVEELTQELEAAKAQPAVPVPTDDDAPEEKTITAEDDLFFEPEEEAEAIKPDKKKKNRHEHSHVNPYQQKAKDKEKGYTQQRQYTFFDINEE